MFFFDRFRSCLWGKFATACRPCLTSNCEDSATIDAKSGELSVKLKEFYGMDVAHSKCNNILKEKIMPTNKTQQNKNQKNTNQSQSGTRQQGSSNQSTNQQTGQQSGQNQKTNQKSDQSQKGGQKQNASSESSDSEDAQSTFKNQPPMKDPENASQNDEYEMAEDDDDTKDNPYRDFQAKEDEDSGDRATEADSNLQPQSHQNSNTQSPRTRM
jgi:hypothetical protein